MRRETLLATAVVILVLAALAAKSLLVSVPPVRSIPGQFDATRAKARLAFVLGDQRPHPADSQANDVVRARIVDALRYVGLHPIVRDQFACNGSGKAPFVACARVRNVVAILGPPTGRALLISAHYDSVPVGPGASDDGIGVATLLEVGSLLKDRPLKRPVILLFNEGEELGLIGARAFLADPLSRTIDSVLNFEARGVTGPATMFETSRPSGAAIEVLARTARRPFASSMSTDIYHLMPNDTDVTVYNERGWLALNFAIMGNETHYHSPGDDLASLDPRSLQHMGDQALAAASSLAHGLPSASGQRIFMDMTGRWFVQMPLWAGLAVFGALFAAFGLVTFRRGAYGAPLAAPFGALIVGTAAAWLATRIMGTLHHGFYWRAHPEFSFVAIYATVLAAALAILRPIGGSAALGQLRAAYWLSFLALGGALTLAAPGAIIYFLGPPILVAFGIAASRWEPRAEAFGSLLAIALLYLTWGEMLALLEELFSPGPLWIVAPPAAIVIMPALIEGMPLFGRASRHLNLLGPAVVALAAWAIVAVAPAYSAERQQRFTIEHVTEFPSRNSSWSVLSDGARLPAALEQAWKWRGGKLPYSDQMRALAPAPPAPGIVPPALEPLDIVNHGSERLLRLRLKANGAERILLTAPAGARIRAAGVRGSVRPVIGASPDRKFFLSCAGRSCDGAEIILNQGTAGPTDFTLVGSRNGLPPSAVPLLRDRPRFARPQYIPDQTVAATIVRL